MRWNPKRNARLRSLALTCAIGGFVPLAHGEIVVDYRNPVAGDRFELLVSRAEPYATLQIVAFDEATKLAGQVVPVRASADGSGSLRYALDLPAGLAGGKLNFFVSEERPGAARVQLSVRIVPPTLLVTGVARGGGVLYRVPIVGSGENPFDLANSELVRLGPASPGGAVRDGRKTKTFVVSDPGAGLLTVLGDADGSRLDLSIAPRLRGIQVTPDGRTVLLTAAGVEGANAQLFLVPTDEPQAFRSVDLGFPFGAKGGERIAVSEDGVRAFVTLDGALLREVNLLALEPGSKLFAVGAPGLDEIRDLRIVGDRLVALTGKAGAVRSEAERNELEPRDRALSAITHVDLADPRRAAIARASGRDSTLDLAVANGKLSLFLLDGGQGEVRVLDVETLAARGTFTVPAGADALLLTPDPTEARAALLYRAGQSDSYLRPLDLASGAIAAESPLRFAAHPQSITGLSSQIELFFVKDAADRLVAIRPDLSSATVLPLDIAIVAVSVGD